MIDQQEQQEVLSIANQYFLNEFGSQELADEAMGKLAAIVQDDGAKLVHFGNVLFLILVRGKGAVEIHTMSIEPNPRELVKNFIQLIDYLRNIGTKVAYTYSDQKYVERLMDMTKLPMTKKKVDVDGSPSTVYIMEL